MGTEDSAEPPAVRHLQLRDARARPSSRTPAAGSTRREWNGTISEKLYVEARYGDFGYYFPLLTNGDEAYFFRDTGLQTLTGSQQRWQLDRDRKQLTGAATYFLDTTKGSHTIKFGGEMLKEQAWEGYEQQFGGNIDHQYAQRRLESAWSSRCRRPSRSAALGQRTRAA